MMPGTIYEILEEIIDPIPSTKHKVKYSPELEQALKEEGIPYEIIRCQSCGGRVKKIEFPILEVVD